MGGHSGGRSPAASSRIASRASRQLSVHGPWVRRPAGPCLRHGAAGRGESRRIVRGRSAFEVRRQRAPGRGGGSGGPQLLLEPSVAGEVLMRGASDMPSKIRVTFRFKILLSVLIVVTTVVSLITFTMARMFHADKVAYVEDLVSLVSVHAASEANLRLSAYQDQLVTAGRVQDASNILGERRDEALWNLFTRTRGLVALRVFEDGKMVRLLLDSLATNAAGVSRASFLTTIARYTIPFDSIEVGTLYVRNSALSSLLPLS